MDTARGTALRRRPAGIMRKVVSLAAAATLAASGMLVGIPGAAADSAPVNPTDPRTPVTVTADALPTVQIDGVVWQQVVVGNTVYAAGSFTTARPAGAAPGTGTVVRNNILAYDIRTGQLIESFAPNLNAEAVAITASPDGKRIYVGGSFTSVNGARVWRVAALNASTGALIPSFAPKMDASVRAIAAVGDTVYLGGLFSAVGSAPRSRLAAFKAADATLLDWAPAASGGRVNALSVSPDGSKIVVGGAFTTLNGSNRPGFGLGAVDTATGASLPFPINDVVRNGSTHGSITSLFSDGTNVYGSGYTYGRTSTLEGIFAVRWSDFGTEWIEDCHGDTYSVYADASVVYSAGHAHYCGNIGGFPQENPWTFNRAIAFGKKATQTLTADPHGYTSYTGMPAPSLLNWFPSLLDGTYTGQNQGPWSVAGNSDYIVMGGEFPSVNGTRQQGLVRFAKKENAPNLRGPRVTGANFNPTVVSTAPGTVRVRWQANWDQDNKNLTYTVLRDSVEIYRTSQESTFWERPSMTYIDTSVRPGRTYRYRVTAQDPLGNIVRSDMVDITAPATVPEASGYERTILADKPTNYWRLGESAGSRTGFDLAGKDDLKAGTGVKFGTEGAVKEDANSAVTLSGTTAGILANPTLVKRPNTFSTEAWFKTTSRTGGKIIGFGNMAETLSSNYDRHVYMDNAGKLYFGVSPGGVRRTVNTAAALNDGAWHHVVATLGDGGMRLYVDGKLAASRADTTYGEAYDGYWRVGGDNLQNWSSRPTNRYFTGQIDEVAVYPAQLSAETVTRHFDAGRGIIANLPPAAVIKNSVEGLSVSFDGSESDDTDGSIVEHAWDFGDGNTALGETVQHSYQEAGTYRTVLTVTDNGGAQGTAESEVTVEDVPAEPFAATDTFERVVSGGLGTADEGGDWTLAGAASSFSVRDGAAGITLPRAGAGPSALLLNRLSTDTDARVSVSLDKAANGGGIFLSLVGRSVPGAGDYRVKVKAAEGSNLVLSLTRTVSGTETTLATRTLSGVRLAAGEVLNLRVSVTGTAPAYIAGKAWKAGTAEPDWQLQSEDASAPLQMPGGVGLQTYLAGSATNAPVVARFDDLAARVPGMELPNAAPVARFKTSVSGLTVSVDASESSDPDGTLARYAWDFGDGASGDGMQATHTFTGAGTYPVTLTVTDDGGATSQIVSGVSVAPVETGGALALDGFDREVASGLGDAELGGAWSLAGAAANFSVSQGAARMQVPRAGSGLNAFLPAGTGIDTESSTSVSLDKIPTGGGAQLSLVGRRVDDRNDYRAVAKIAASGAVTLDLTRTSEGSNTQLASQFIRGLNLAPSEQLHLKLSAVSTGDGGTMLKAKAWKEGTAEPADWQVSTVDTTPSLQAAGASGLLVYISGSAGNVPVTISWDRFEVKAL